MPMHTKPLRTQYDTDLLRAIEAVDPDDPTTVLPVVDAPEPESKRGLVLAAVGGVLGLGALALLVALVVGTSNESTRPTVVTPPLAPVTETTPVPESTTAQAITTTPSAEVTPSPSASVAPPPAVHTSPPTAVVSAETIAPPDPVRTRLRELFPRLFP